MMNYLKEKGWKKLEISKTEKKTVSRSEVKALFNYIDKDRSGFISLEVCVFSFHLIFILLSLIVKHVLTCPEICQWWIMMRVIMRMWHRTWGVSDASSIELLKESVQFIYNFQEAKNVRLLIQARFEITEVKMAFWSWSFLLICPLALQPCIIYIRWTSGCWSLMWTTTGRSATKSSARVSRNR